MSVAHDAVSESHTGTTGSASEASFSWTHTPSGTPRGVLVFTFVNTNADDATGVSYGGVALTAVPNGRAVDTATEAGDCKAWFLGENIPTGAQTVEVSRNNNANVMYAICITQTADRDTKVGTPVLLQNDGTLAEQSVTDDSPGSDSVRYAAVNSGLGAVPAAGTNSTSLGTGATIDFGARVTGAVRETTAGQGARSVGFSSGTSDDRAAVHLAVLEDFSKIEMPAGSVALSGLAASLLIPTLLAMPAGALALTGTDVGVAFTGPPEGSVALVGYAPTVVTSSGTTIAMPVGGLSVTGATPSLAFVVHTPAGTLVTTGGTPALALTVPVGAGAIDLVGYALAGAGSVAIPVPVGTLALTGTDVTVAFPGPSPGWLQVIGHAPTVVVSGSTTIPVPAGTLTLTGAAPSLALGMPVAKGTLTLTGLAPTVFVARLIAMPAGSLTLSGNYVAIAFNLPPAGNVTFTGYAPTVVIATAGQIPLPAGTLAITGAAPVVARALVVPSGLLALSGTAPAVVIAGSGQTIAVPAGALAFTGAAPVPARAIVVPAGSLALSATTAVVGRALALASGTLTCVGVSPTLALTLSIPAGSLSLSGTPVSVGGNVNVLVPVGTLTISGQTPVLVKGPTLQLGVGTLTLSGQGTRCGFTIGIAPGAVLLTGMAPSGHAPQHRADVVFVVPAEDRRFVVPSESRRFIVPEA